ncbi:hypothetical protein HK102_006556 [Quaeritorhiza haematococci]|nr:hypothetical protein HK102_006556 [Quaeritorhiza haematococci]
MVYMKYISLAFFAVLGLAATGASAAPMPQATAAPVDPNPPQNILRTASTTSVEEAAKSDIPVDQAQVRVAAEASNPNEVFRQQDAAAAPPPEVADKKGQLCDTAAGPVPCETLAERR